MNLITWHITFTNKFTKISMLLISYCTNKEIIQQLKHHSINIPKVFECICICIFYLNSFNY